MILVQPWERSYPTFRISLVVASLWPVAKRSYLGSDLTLPVPRPKPGYRTSISISWDFVLHCEPDPDPIARVQGRRGGTGFSLGGHALTPGDASNLRHVGRVLTSFARTEVRIAPNRITEPVA